MRTYRSVIGLLVVFLSGCASIPDHAEKADALGELPPAFDGATAMPAASADESAPWHLAFADPALDALVREAGQANADVAIAALRMREAYALAQAERASRWPLLGLGVEATRGRLAEGAGEPVQEFSTVGLQASYEVDLWGRLAAGRAAAFERYLADRHAAEAVRLSITGTVVRSYFDLQLLRERVRILDASLEAFDRSLALSTRRHEEGLLSELDLQRLRAEREDIAARRIVADQATRDAERRLVLLLGRAPTATARQALPVTSIEDASAILPAVPVGVPSELLLRRPDLQAAEARLRAAAADLTAARRALFPSLRLTGQFGRASSDLGDVLDGFDTWSLAMDLLATVFDGGARRAAIDVSDARREQLLVAYRDAVRRAFADVVQALDGRDSAAQALAIREARLRAQARVETLAERRYTAGLSSQLDVIDAQRKRLDAQLDVAEARAATTVAYADLMLALGASTEPVDSD